MAKNVRVHEAIRERLRDDLPTALKRDFGLRARQEDIVGALVHGITVPQLAGMLMEYERYTATAAATSTPPDDTGH
jgi:hypothetical protein